MQEPMRAANLPRIHPLAWQGAVGEAVLRIAPSTEADPVAVLASALALFGALAGDGSYVRVGGAKHPPRVWPLIIGKTGSGRKGTSWAVARHLASDWGDYAAHYLRARIEAGLVSGEGLIGALGGGPPGQDPDNQPAAPDGKLTVLETEFARVLSAAKRDGSTLGPVLRQLWDDGDAGIMTRSAPLKVQGAHVTVVAHVTPRELRLRLAESDLAGGTLNRFLLIASERPHLLAHEVRQDDVTREAQWLADAVARCRTSGSVVRRNREAEALWPEVYAALSEEEPDGQLGSVLARGPAYTMRLALIYALVDGAGSIEPRHLLSALAVWHYAAETAKGVFPEGRPSDDLTRLAEFLTEPGGRTATDVIKLFRGNRTSREIGHLMAQLERYGKLTRTTEPRTGPGRPTHRYAWSGRLESSVWEVLQRHSATN